jgi:hypothetical protein
MSSSLSVVGRLVPSAVLSSLLLLGACELPPPTTLAPTTLAPSTGVTPGQVPDPAPRSQGETGGAPSTAAAPLGDPGGFRGLPAKEVLARLGDPSYRRHESPAEIWQYYGPGCILDLFFYDEQGTTRVTYIELRNQLPGQSSVDKCLSQLLDRHHGQQNS